MSPLKDSSSVYQPRYLQVLGGWYETGRGENRVLAMEGLRGLAILLVFFCHFQMVILSRVAEVYQSRMATMCAEIGGTGVDLFFLLSGMLIYRAAMRPGVRYSRFLLRRVQRIYPTFLAVLAFYLVLSVGFHFGEHYKAIGALAQLRYIGANLLLLPGILDIPPVISAAWSLSYEFAFYLTLPILVRVFRMSSWGRTHRTLFWALIICGYLAFAASNPIRFPHYQFQDGSFVRFTLFLAGMILEEVLHAERGLRFLSPLMQRLLLLLAISALCGLIVSELHTVQTLAHHSLHHAVLRAVLVLIMYSVLSCLTLQPRGILATFFSHHSLRWTGNISYSFYLIHGFVLNVVAVAVAHVSWAKHHPATAAPILLILALLSTFVTATVLFLLVEKPLSLSAPKPRTMPHSEPLVALSESLHSFPAGEHT